MTRKDVSTRLKTHQPIVSILPPSGFSVADVREFIVAMNNKSHSFMEIEPSSVKLRYNAERSKYYVTGQVTHFELGRNFHDINDKLQSYVNECNEISEGVFILLEVPRANDTIQTKTVTLIFKGVRKITWGPIGQNIRTTDEILCPNCGMNNWSTRHRCRRCGAPL
jgi:ribosomal protein S27AE